MADNRELHERAVEAFTKLVAPVTDEQWDAPTPCTEWKVKDLVAHVVGGNYMFGEIAKGEKPSGRQPEGDLKDALADSAQFTKDAFAADDVNDRMFELPFGTMPAQIAIGIHTTDVIVHAWDLAKATGQEPVMDSDLLEAAYSLVQLFPETPQLRGENGPFGPKVECAADAPLYDRLVAHLGRTP